MTFTAMRVAKVLYVRICDTMSSAMTGDFESTVIHIFQCNVQYTVDTLACTLYSIYGTVMDY